MLYFPCILKTQFTGIYKRVHIELKDEVSPGDFVAESSVHIATTGSSKQIQTTYTVTNKCLTAKETLYLIHRSQYEPQTFSFYSFITSGHSFIKGDKL